MLGRKKALNRKQLEATPRQLVSGFISLQLDDTLFVVKKMICTYFLEDFFSDLFFLYLAKCQQ